jgi:hypothetical protein
MAQRILRNTTLAIAQEDTFGTESTNTAYVLPNIDLSLEEVINTQVNESQTGTDFAANNVLTSSKMINVSFTTKVDENILPLMLRNKFSVDTSTTESGAVYEHELTYDAGNTPESGESFTLFFDDDDIADQVITGFRFGSMEFTFEVNGFARVACSGRGIFPTSGTVNNSVTSNLREFVGKHASYQLGDYGDSLSSQDLYALAIAMEFNLLGDDTTHYLGDVDLQNNFTGSNSIMETATLPFDTDYSLRDDAVNNTEKMSKTTITDTNRTIGSASNPSIVIEHPVMQYVNWSRDGDMDGIEKQVLEAQVLSRSDESDSPSKITVTNTVASYV